MIIKSIFLVTVLFATFSFGQIPKSELKTVDYVDLIKYSGRWYEIAKLPNRFQKHCAKNVTAEYKLRAGNKIDVINSCVEEDGEIDQAEGLAKVVDSKTNSKLEVSFVSIFGIHLFWGDYWIIGLDKNYEYAVVGTPSRKYGWILARTPKLSDEKLNEAFEILKAQGYDANKFIITKHD